MVKRVSRIKNELHEIKKRVTQPERIVFDICNYDRFQYAWLFSDKCYIKSFYKKHMRKKLNLSNPTTFNEKLQWLKLHDRQPRYTQMADKAEMKQYVASVLGEGYTITTIGVYDTVEAVPFDQLPDQYVIKCTHDSGSTFICKDKKNFDVAEVKKQLSQQLKKNFYWAGREWAYKNINPRIIVEEYICDENGNYPLDYKMFCFSGKMQFFKVDYNRFTSHRANYYNRSLQLQDFGEYWVQPDLTIPFDKPKDFERMIEIADKLSAGIPFVRVDLYYVKGRIYVGELTFYPAGGVGILINDGDRIMGSYLKLPEKK